MSSLPKLSSPRISVVVCNYNYESFVASAVESVLAQTRAAHELIVIDDGSTDGSRSILEQYQARGVRVTYQRNGGQLAAYNSGFDQTTGDVVLFLDADDLLAPNALESVAARFGENVAKVHFRLRLIDDLGKDLGGTIPRGLSRGNVATPFMTHGIPPASPPASGNAFRRSILERLFPLPTDDPGDRHGADFFCVYGATLLGEVAACEEVLGAYRVHTAGKATNLTFGNADADKDLALATGHRYERFKRWLAQRAPELVLSDELLDFSIEKTAFAQAVLGQPRAHDPRATIRKWRKLLRSVYLRDDYSAAKKLGLTCWSIAVVAAPRTLAYKAALYVCNPGARRNA